MATKLRKRFFQVSHICAGIPLFVGTLGHEREPLSSIVSDRSVFYSLLLFPRVVVSVS